MIPTSTPTCQLQPLGAPDLRTLCFRRNTRVIVTLHSSEDLMQIFTDCASMIAFKAITPVLSYQV